ncbi:MAG: hypothetical protein HUU60_04025 [Armatimonadetes bacterium]|nr:hypothetical protein [Armatimonadota bacterium]
MLDQYIDGSLYPDVEDPSQVPTRLETDEEKADYLERVCGAFDFDILPDKETFEMLRGWKDIFDRFPLPHSPAYHAFRLIFGWDPVEQTPNPSIRLTWEILDRLEERDFDPCFYQM